ncbi:MAG: energy-coupling factor ABC transporter permease, partial [Nitrospirae bacterium]|nr:energy-coupling factor ABC transporter permease [Nitrospirota bacterium]
MKINWRYLAAAALTLFCIPQSAYAMHIMEGFLPFNWCAFWYVCSLPFFIYGGIMVKKLTRDNSKLKLLLGLCGAFVFVMSAMKIPSVMGSCSHPTGVGLGAIVFGPSVMTVLG